MKVLKSCVFLLVSCGCYAQGSQPAATADELQFSRFMLMNVGSIDHSPKAIEMYETSLVKQFGLNTQESAVIHAAGQRLNALLQQLRQQSQAVVRGKSALATQDAVALAALSDQRDQLIATLSNQVLNAVRPEVAARLRTPGHVIAGALKNGPGGK